MKERERDRNILTQLKRLLEILEIISSKYLLPISLFIFVSHLYIVYL